MDSTKKSEGQSYVEKLVRKCEACGTYLIPLGDIWVHQPNVQCEEEDGRFVISMSPPLSKKWDALHEKPTTDFQEIINDLELKHNQMCGYGKTIIDQEQTIEKLEEQLEEFKGRSLWERLTNS